MDNNQKVDALLNLATKDDDTKGKLKIFLGYAPGVGKSYAMLNNAKSLQKDGKDVVIGLIISHGRTDTESLIAGLEIIQSKTINYRGSTFQELDVDAIKERRPDVVIIDELAHTNIHGTRNRKRYQDIEELIGVGISVYTAVNIQHIASLSYEVTQISQTNVNEIVPNEFIQSADELVVVDVSPEELIKRLKQGKVYKNDAIDRALEKYFQYTNLAILRDYTFRMAANHVEQDIQQYKKLYKNGNLIPSSPYVLVCCGYDDSSPTLLRKGKHLASTLNARLIAVFVQKPDSLSALSFGLIRRYKMLARNLGYSIDHIMGDKVSDTILEYAESICATDIIIGKSKRPKWRDMFGSVVYDIIRRSNGIQVHVISSNQRNVKANNFFKLNKTKLIKKDFVDAFKSVSVTVIAGIAIFVGIGDIGLMPQTLCFLMVLAFCSYRYGMFASFASSIVGVFLYSYVYLMPNFEFHISSAEGLISFIFFVFMELFLSRAIFKAKTSFLLLQERENRLSVLYRYTKLFNEKNNGQDFRIVFLKALEEYFKCDFVFLNVTDGELESAAFPQHPNFNQKELVSAKWSYMYKKSSGKGTNTFSALSWAIEPLVIEDRVLGVIAIYLRSTEATERVISDSVILGSLLSHISHLLLKRGLEKEEKNMLLLKEQEKLQQSMLSSVSHDLKTPLASIMGSLSSLKSFKDSFSETQKDEMLDIAVSESKRLDGYIDNVIQMLKVESGNLFINISKLDSKYFINEIVSICSRLYQNVDIKILEYGEGFDIDTCKIVISLKEKANNGCVFEVSDNGIGLNQEDLESVFTIFHRLNKKDSYTQGNGLGLSICKGIVDAHYGTIKVYSEGENKGCTFRVTLPLIHASK